MRISVILLLLCILFPLNALAQEYMHWGLPEGAKARLGKGTINDIEYSPNGTRIAVAGSVGIWFYDTATHHEVALLTGQATKVSSIAFSPDGRLLASGGGDFRTSVGTVRLWDAATGEHKQTLAGHTSLVLSVAFSPDGKTLASGCEVNTLRPQAAETVSLDGWRIYGAGGALHTTVGTVRLWDAVKGEHKQTLVGHTDEVRSVMFSPDGRTVASGSRDKTVRLLDAVTGEHLHTLTGHTGWVEGLAFSPDGSVLASGSDDGTVLLWDFSHFSAEN